VQVDRRLWPGQCWWQFLFHAEREFVGNLRAFLPVAIQLLHFRTDAQGSGEPPQLSHPLNSGFRITTMDPIAVLAMGDWQWRLPQSAKCGPAAESIRLPAHAGSSLTGHIASPAAAKWGAASRNRVTAQAIPCLSRLPTSKSAKCSKAASWRGVTSTDTSTRPCRRRSRYASLRWHARSRVPSIVIIARLPRFLFLGPNPQLSLDCRLYMPGLGRRNPDAWG
jgi:hypothetical protein